MKNGEEAEAKAEEEEENLGEKLRKGVLVGKRRGPSTPVPPWRDALLIYSPTPTAHDSIHRQAPPSSARKLAAALWEFSHYFPSLPVMHRGLSDGVSASAAAGEAGGDGDSRMRRHPALQQQHHQHRHKDMGLHLSNFVEDPCPSSPDQSASASSLRRHAAAYLMQHHRSIERNNRALQPMSPSSYGSSMEVVFKERIGYNLKTSKELLKILNRIWSLEEQHTSNVSLIKALKMELNHARIRIKELLRDQQSDHHEIDDLMKQIAEDKMARKNKEQDRIHAAVQSVKDELENEKKLRKRSEALHRKLARDLSEVKSSLSNALKELEKERKSRKLLEDLCDEFSKGIKDYEQELRALKKKSGKGGDDDRLILHVSESWLDERMQMKLEEEAQHGFVGDNSIVDKSNFEQFSRNQDLTEHGEKTAETMKTDQLNNFLASRERVRSRDPSSMQMKFKEQMAGPCLAMKARSPKL